MKIAHLVSSNGLYGAERVLLTLASRMGDSLVIGLERLDGLLASFSQEAERLKVPFYRVPCRGQIDMAAMGRVRSLLKEHHVDILHTHNYKADILGFFASRFLKVSLVATVHGYLSDDPKVRCYERLDRFFLSMFEKVVLVSEEQLELFAGFRTALVHNGIDAESREGSEQLSRPLRVGIMGRLSPEKGHRYLLEAFSNFARRHPDAELHIAGDGPLRPELEKYAQVRGLTSRIRFLGYQKDIAGYYRDVDVFVCASLLEHFPMVVLEAMSRGKAVIATRVGSIPALIKDKETGLLVDPASSEQLSGALEKLAGDPGLKARLGYNARKFVLDNYSEEKMASAYQRVYQEVLKR